MPAINRVDANAELDQRVQLLELQMIEIMKDRASFAAQAASAKEQRMGQTVMKLLMCMGRGLIFGQEQNLQDSQEGSITVLQSIAVRMTILKYLYLMIVG